MSIDPDDEEAEPEEDYYTQLTDAAYWEWKQADADG